MHRWLARPERVSDAASLVEAVLLPLEMAQLLVRLQQQEDSLAWGHSSAEVVAAGREARWGRWPIVKAAIAIVAGAQEMIPQVL